MLPIYIGVVDVTGCPDFIKTVQKSLYSIIDNLADGMFPKIAAFNVFIKS